MAHVSPLTSRESRVDLVLLISDFFLQSHGMCWRCRRQTLFLSYHQMRISVCRFRPCRNQGKSPAVIL